MTRANQRQVGGTHYAAAYQHWDFVLDCELGYLEGCATKYVLRWRQKGGFQDLEKAIHYCEKMLGSMGRLIISDREFNSMFLTQMINAYPHGVPAVEVEIIRKISTWATEDDLMKVIDDINELIGREKAIANAQT